MKKVTKNNLIKLVELKKQYLKNNDENILVKINDFIDNAINKDKKYYSKLSSYDFDEETKKFLIKSGVSLHFLFIKGKEE